MNRSLYLPPMDSLYAFAYQYLRVNGRSCRSDDIYSCGGEIKAILDDTRPHYRKILIPKPSKKEMRTVFEVTQDLRSLQHFIKRYILDRLDAMYTSPYAFAYRLGLSARDNASAHAGHRYMLKLDIRHFFESTRAGQVYSMFRKYTPYNRQILGTLTRLVCYKGALCQGACTSPQIANLILSDFDMAIGTCCRDMCITYTRYCDDMTFSSVLPFDKSALERTVALMLQPYHYKLNTRKTRFLGPGHRLEVTGAVVNERVHAKREYRQKIRQELYYANRYGVADHLERTRPPWYHTPCSSAQVRHFLYSLQGRINYVRMLDPNDPFLEDAQFQLFRLLLREQSAFRHIYADEGPVSQRQGSTSGFFPEEGPVGFDDLDTDLMEPPFNIPDMDPPELPFDVLGWDDPFSG
ncbi:MAG: RNA-directed DNA polymerase [Clostridiales bacterium]|nr:RNA-directed DNA polymerase [Clostridiales bacterium]